MFQCGGIKTQNYFFWEFSLIKIDRLFLFYFYHSSKTSIIDLISICNINLLTLNATALTILLPAPGSVSVICDACYSAHRIGRTALFSLPAPPFLLPAEAAFGDQKPVPITPVVPSLIPSRETAAAIRAVEVIATLSTQAASVRRRGKTISEDRQTKVTCTDLSVSNCVRHRSLSRKQPAT